MEDALSDTTARNQRGEWRPAEPIGLPPIFDWPPKPGAATRWFLGFPGYLVPLNGFWFALAVVTWVFLTPELATMATIEPGWIAWLLVRNAGLILAVFGGLHLYLYIRRGQGDHLKFSTEPLATNSRRFLFKDQVRDNMFRSMLYAVPVVTGFEAATYWGFANGYLGWFEINDPVLFWVWFTALAVLCPVIHSAHFYLGHRLLHTAWLYKKVHALHHRNVEVGPWSGLAMHPVEHVIYFSTTVVQWALALHPVNALFQLQFAIFNAAMSHTGFQKVMVGEKLPIDSNSYFHYLHHQFFECNYGGTVVPFDKIFGTHHDGTREAQIAMRERLAAMRRARKEA